jgi:Peptidase family M23
VIARRAKAPRLKVGAPLTVTPPLRGGPYVFPVGGDVGFSDSYAAARSDVPGGWHHGDDLFSGLGSPVLAVADGVVFSVGWNRVGGWRLWLRDRQGNEFYYAHLSGYTRLAHNGDHVTAGQPLAFVGNTGDAITTPHHLHFEIHPVGLLRLGYDGAVDPTTYLNTWKHLTRVSPLAPVRLPAGAALHGDGALSDYRQLLIARGILPTRHQRGVPSALTVLGPSLLPELNVTPAVLSAPQVGWQAAVAAGLAACFSVTALLLRFRIRELGRGLRR